jgi:molybdenum cofactor guanylyltransferase
MTGTIDRKGRVAAAIIAGGKGTRLGGVDKTALVVGGRTILDRQLEALRGRFSRVFLALGDSTPAALPPGVVVVRDRVAAGSGPLAGLDAALGALAPAEESVICIAADLPLLSPPTLELLRDTAPDAEALVPLVAGQPEPLFARYHTSCGPPVAAALREGRLKTMAVLASVRVQWIAEATLRAADPHLRCLLNVNTPEDLARAEALLAEAARPAISRAPR